MASIVGSGKVAIVILIAAIAISKAGGKLPQPPSKAAAAPAPCVGQEVKQFALQHGIEPGVVAAVIKVESNWQPDAKGSAGELGLMQLMARTAKAMGVKDRLDPVDNVKGGIKFLAYCKEKTANAYLRCYNAGEKGIHLPAAKKYEQKVMLTLQRSKGQKASIRG